MLENKDFKEIERPRSAEWDLIPLGVSSRGHELWNLSEYGQAAIFGLAGIGKSVLIGQVVDHVLNHPDDFNAVIIDPIGDYAEKFEDGVVRFISDGNIATKALMDVRDVMMERFSRMKEAGVNHIDKIRGTKSPAVLVIIDEINSIRFPSEAYREIFFDCLKSIVQMGQSAKVYVLVSSQTATRGVMPEVNLLENFGLRILLGPSNEEESNAVLGEDSTKKIDYRGRKRNGIISRGGEEEEFKEYWEL